MSRYRITKDKTRVFEDSWDHWYGDVYDFKIEVKRWYGWIVVKEWTSETGLHDRRTFYKYEISEAEANEYMKLPVFDDPYPKR